jgi:predicted O-methyltransferase YrrM
MNRKLEKFLDDHTSAEDPVLEDLYRQTHIRFVNPNMASGHLQGKFLQFISMMIKPDRILEIGTFTGYSAICLARGLKTGGKLITIEINDELTAFSRAYFEKAGLGPQIIQMTGKAQDLIPGLGEAFDLIYIDGDKREYPEYFRAALAILRPGGIIIADNVLWGGQALEEESGDPQASGIIEFNRMIREDLSIEKVTIPLRDGLMLIRKNG